MRTFKRLFPIFLVPVLLAGVALARPSAQTGTNLSPTSKMKTSNPQFSPGYSHAPETPRLYFGTVVRDTADDQSVSPGRWHALQEVAPWTSSFFWGWFSLLTR